MNREKLFHNNHKKVPIHHPQNPFYKQKITPKDFCQRRIFCEALSTFTIEFHNEISKKKINPHAEIIEFRWLLSIIACCIKNVFCGSGQKCIIRLFLPFFFLDACSEVLCDS